MTLRTYHRFLDAATTASASNTYNLTDYRHDEAVVRTIQGTIQNGANVALTTYLHQTDDTVSVLVSTFGANFQYFIAGPVARIKVEKVGASGSAWVEGLV
jgi:hypothetical protein